VIIPVAPGCGVPGIHDPAVPAAAARAMAAQHRSLLRRSHRGRCPRRRRATEGVFTARRQPPHRETGPCPTHEQCPDLVAEIRARTRRARSLRKELPVHRAARHKEGTLASSRSRPPAVSSSPALVPLGTQLVSFGAGPRYHVGTPDRGP